MTQKGMQDLRYDLKWTQADMAVYLGVSMRTYLRYENLELPMSGEKLYLLGKVYDAADDEYIRYKIAEVNRCKLIRDEKRKK